MLNRRGGLLALAAAGAVLTGACGGASDTSEAAEEPAEEVAVTEVAPSATPAPTPSLLDDALALSPDSGTVVARVEGRVLEIEATKDALFLLSASVDGDVDLLTRVDRSTGEATATRELAPESRTERSTMAQLEQSLALLEGSTDQVQLLDPATLETIGVVPVPAGPKTVAATGPQSGMVVASWRANEDLAAGVLTAQQLTAIGPDTEREALERGSAEGFAVDLPVCGGRDGLFLGDDVWITVRCSWLLARVTPDGDISYLPMHRGEAWLSEYDGMLWLSYTNDGLISQVDPATGESRTVALFDDPDMRIGDVRFADATALVMARSETERREPLLITIDTELTTLAATALPGVVPTFVVEGGDVLVPTLDGHVRAIPLTSLSSASLAVTLVEPPADLQKVEPSDPLVQQIEADFEPLLDPAAPSEVIAGILADAEQLEDERQAVIEFFSTNAPGVRVRVLSFVQRGDEAVATYVLELDGVALFGERPATLHRVGDTWQLDRDTFCTATALLLIECD